MTPHVALRIACMNYIVLLGAIGQSFAVEVEEVAMKVPVTGAVNDMANQTYAQGIALHVNFRDIRYEGQVARLLVERKAADRMTVWVGLRDMEVTIHSTTISGRRHRARCGPMQVVIGSQETAWMAFHVAQQDGEELRLLRELTQFGFSDANWSIGNPAWVNASGIGMTQSRVVSGLRSGLASQRSEFERQILEVAPTIFESIATHVREHLEKQLLVAN